VDEDAGYVSTFVSPVDGEARNRGFFRIFMDMEVERIFFFSDPWAKKVVFLRAAEI
jgi:hypothetical protein